MEQITEGLQTRRQLDYILNHTQSCHGNYLSLTSFLQDPLLHLNLPSLHVNQNEMYEQTTVVLSYNPDFVRLSKQLSQKR